MNINEVHWNFSDNGTKEPAKSRFWNFYNFWTAWNFLMRFSLLCTGERALSFYICVFFYTGVSLKVGRLARTCSSTSNSGMSDVHPSVHKFFLIVASWDKIQSLSHFSSSWPTKAPIDVLFFPLALWVTFFSIDHIMLCNTEIMGLLEISI